jgi:hypothetical protein
MQFGFDDDGRSRSVHPFLVRSVVVAAVVCLAAAAFGRISGAENAHPVGKDKDACVNRPANGAQLGGFLRGFNSPGHKIEIRNGPVSDAIIKVKDIATNQLAISFFVAAGESATFPNLADGRYKIQYAIGSLGDDCHSMKFVITMGEFPTLAYLASEIVGGKQIMPGLTYSLYGGPSRWPAPRPIDEATFDTD